MSWITDRLPTAEDADPDGDIQIKDSFSAYGWIHFKWHNVKVGEPWWSAKAADAAEVAQQPTTAPARIITDDLDEEYDKARLQYLQAKVALVKAQAAAIRATEPAQPTPVRKIVQISSPNSTDVFVLCDDGSVWLYRALADLQEWTQLPAIPQQEAK